MGTRKVQRTLVASEGISLTSRFEGTFFSDRVSGYLPRLTEPPDSTGGGKQAIQHISLQAADFPGPPLTAGWVNCATKEAKLRTLACMQSILTHRSSGRRVRLDPQAYQQFFEKCWTFLESQGLRPVAEHEPPPIAAGASSSSVGRGGAGPVWAWILVTLVLLAVVLLGVLVVTGRVSLGRG